MNKKGFTLIEILFVVVLMAIIATITMPNIFKMLQSSKDKKYAEYEKLLIENLKLYNIDHKEALWGTNNEVKTIGYLDLLTVNPDIDIEGCRASDSGKDPVLSISKSGNQYTYTVCMYCQSSNDSEPFYYPKNCQK